MRSLVLVASALAWAPARSVTAGCAVLAAGRTAFATVFHRLNCPRRLIVSGCFWIRFLDSDVLRYKLTITVTSALYLQTKTATDVISTRCPGTIKPASALFLDHGLVSYDDDRFASLCVTDGKRLVVLINDDAFDF